VARRKKLGLALGAGGARGFAHIGVLKALHENKFFPDYIAGTSMGAVVGAMYAAGISPSEIQKIVQKTKWKKVVDFTEPKLGLLQGRAAENKLAELLNNKSFNQLEIPLKVVSYNLTQKKLVVFGRGKVARALRASISIPGIFHPAVIAGQQYIDGAVADPTPYDIVREMGADVIIAVDLFSTEMKVQGPVIHQQGVFDELKNQFIKEELNFLRTALFPEKWPEGFRKFFDWVFDKILYPARILRMLAGAEHFPITKVMYEAVTVMTNNLARERYKNADVDVSVRPNLGHLRWNDFGKVNQFAHSGEKAMLSKIGLLKKKLK